MNFSGQGTCKARQERRIDTSAYCCQERQALYFFFCQAGKSPATGEQVTSPKVFGGFLHCSVTVRNFSDDQRIILKHSSLSISFINALRPLFFFFLQPPTPNSSPMPSSSHYIRTVRTEFTGTGSAASSSSSTTRSSSSSSRENDGLDVQNAEYPPGLGLYSTWRSSPASVNIHQMAGGSGSSKHPQRPAVRIPFSNRRSLPSSSSSSASRAPTSYLGNASQRDPYSSWNYSLIYDSHPVSRTYRFATEMEPSQSMEPSAKTPQLKPLDRDERSKLVAGILLHRVHAVGKPLRRKPEDKEKPYVRSSLSRVVRMEA
jgi:hypothetical protein